MLVRQVKVGPMENFVYLVMDGKSRDALVVDSGWETAPLVRAADESGARVKFVVASHEHFDHVSTLDELASKFGAQVVAHVDSPVRCDIRAEDRSELRLGESAVKVLHTPGHTPDSVSLYDGKNVFTGDTLFVGTIGRFDRSGAEKMFRSLRDVLMKLPPETVMYPGHDYGRVPSRTLGEEGADNPYLQARKLTGFVSLFS